MVGASSLLMVMTKSDQKSTHALSCHKASMVTSLLKETESSQFIMDILEVADLLGARDVSFTIDRR